MCQGLSGAPRRVADNRPNHTLRVEHQDFAMQRRKFLAVFSLAVTAGHLTKPVLAANQPRHVIGFFNVPIPSRTELTDAFKSGLRKFGLIPGANIRLDFKTTDSKNELLDKVAAEIVSENPDVVVTWG